MNEQLSVSEAQNIAKHFSDILKSQHNLTPEQEISMLQAISYCRTVILKSNLKKNN